MRRILPDILVLAVAAASILTLLSGCDRSTAPTRPLGAPAPDTPAHEDDPLHAGRGLNRMPMAIGDRWVYSRDYRLSIVTPGGMKNTFFIATGTITQTLGCVDTMPTGVYAFQHSTEIQRFDKVSNTSVSWSDLRQDAKGLYEVKPPNDAVPSCFDDGLATAAASGDDLDAAATLARVAIAHLPPAPDAATAARRRNAVLDLSRRAGELDRPLRGRPGPRDGESRLLAYPLHVGQCWSFVEISTGRTLDARVIAHELCSVPAGSWRAARIATTWVGNAGPRDTVERWYGSAGLLRYRYHLQSGGDLGDPIFVIENDQRLTRLNLTGNSHHLPERGH